MQGQEQQLKNLNNKFQNFDAQIDQLKKMIVDLEAQKKDLQSKLASARLKIAELNKTIEQLGSN